MRERTEADIIDEYEAAIRELNQAHMEKLAEVGAWYKLGLEMIVKDRDNALAELEEDET